MNRQIFGKALCRPLIGNPGCAATLVETELAMRSPPAQVTTPSAQLLTIANRVAASVSASGALPHVARLAAATAVVAVLDEVGGERVQFPTRRGFFFSALRPAMPALVGAMAERMTTTEIADFLDVSLRTVQRAISARANRTLFVSPDFERESDA